jgi:hypothetical protein
MSYFWRQCKGTNVFIKTARYFCPILTKFGIYRSVFLISPISDFTTVRLVGAALIHADIQTDVRTDHDEASNYFSKNCLSGVFSIGLILGCVSHKWNLKLGS